MANLSNELKQARPIQTSLQGRVYRDRVGFVDLSDAYRFRLDGRSVLTVTVRNLAEDVDLFLLNSNGRTIARSRNPGKASEVVSRSSTEKGTYYLRVVSRSGPTPYRLEISAIPQSRFNTDDNQTVTPLFVDINRGATGSAPRDLTIVGNNLFFTADDGVNGRELWVSNGRAQRTRLVTDFNPGETGSDPRELVDVNGVLYFTADDGRGNGRELYRTVVGNNGAISAIELVSDLNIGEASSFPTDLVNVNGTLYFAADDGRGNGRELYRTVVGNNSTISGVEQIIDLNRGEASSNPAHLVNLNGVLYFSADNGLDGRELFRTEGNQTTQVIDLNLGNVGSDPADLVAVGNQLFFTADDGRSNGRELFRSDGTSAGTRLVLDLNRGEGSAFPAPADSFLTQAGQEPTIDDRQILAAVNNTLYFAAADGRGAVGTELYRTNGTVAGTQLVIDLNRGITGSDPQELTNVNGRLFFSAIDVRNGRELFRTNGTTRGTVLISNISPDGDSDPTELTVLGTNLFFAATTSTFGQELQVYSLRSPTPAPAPSPSPTA